MRILLIALSLALACSIVYNVVQYKEAARNEGVKLEWSYDAARDMQICRLRADSSLVSIWYDLNEDLENDSCVNFDNQGRSSEAWVDQDRDGVFDLAYLFDATGKIVATHEDSDRNGRYEDYTWYTADSLITYRDEDQDGFFAMDEIIERRKR